MEKENSACKVLIIGSGPAGLSAAIYTARAGLNTVIISGTTIGGQASLTSEIENYPGFPEEISGSELVDRFQKQAEKFGAVMEYAAVEKVDFSQLPFLVETDSKLFQAENVIIASGSQHILMNVPGEKEFTGKGVSYCATCDGFFYRGKKVVVIGGGNSAVEEAIFLTRFAEQVTIVHRRDALRADPILQQRARENPKIQFVWDSVPVSVSGNEKLESIRLRNLKTNQETDFATDGVFVFIGFRTVTDLYQGQVEIEENVIKVDEKMHTSVPGIYAAGESVDNFYRQVITSAGSGAMAGISVTKENL